MAVGTYSASKVTAAFHERASRLCYAAGLIRLSARFAAMASMLDIGAKRTARRSLLISGLGRVGKSKLACCMSDKYDYEVLTTDKILNYFFRIKDDEARWQFRQHFYTFILNKYPEGLIIEGDDFILKNRADIAKIDHEVDISLAVVLTRRCGVDAWLLGNSEITADDKLRAFAAFSAKERCWTRQMHKRGTLRDYALWLIRVSKRLRELADGRTIHYVEVDSDGFDQCIESTADAIALRNLKRSPASPPSSEYADTAGRYG